MSIVAKAADRMLTAVVPRATASAVSCTNGCWRATCYCRYGYWYDHCISSHGECHACFKTVWPC
jgi:hypothetical protein